MKRLFKKVRARRSRRDDGASAVEYGLLVALVAVVIAGAVVFLGNALEDQFQDACVAVDATADCGAPAGGGGG